MYTYTLEIKILFSYTLTYHEFSFPPGELNLKNKTYDGSLGYLQRNVSFFILIVKINKIN